MRDKTGEVTGCTTVEGRQEPMDTSAALRQEANALLGAPTSAGGEDGGGVGGEDLDVPPPPTV